MDSLFADLDQDLELQYEEEEFEFFLMGMASNIIFILKVWKYYICKYWYSSPIIETQCIAEEIIEEAITGALSELYIEIEKQLRTGKGMTHKLWTILYGPCSLKGWDEAVTDLNPN